MEQESKRKAFIHLWCELVHIFFENRIDIEVYINYFSHYKTQKVLLESFLS